MKKLLLLSALLIFACSNDDSNNSNLSSIEGRWDLVSITTAGVNEVLNDCDLQSYMELSNNGSGTYFIYYTDDLQVEPCGFDSTFDVLFSGNAGDSNSFTMTFDYGEGSSDTGTALLNNNILIFSTNFNAENEYRFTRN
tara:strand:- start:18 stop:434 length:417 start_codon:yes stop_codon:yes gene_type:complete